MFSSLKIVQTDVYIGTVVMLYLFVHSYIHCNFSRKLIIVGHRSCMHMHMLPASGVYYPNPISTNKYIG